MKTVILVLLCYFNDEGRKSDDYPVHRHLEKVLTHARRAQSDLPLAEALDA